MSVRRPPHKLAHAPKCPFGVSNWTDCDAAAARRWGRCKAMVEAKKQPHTCTNWAIADDGWCGQHYASLREKEMDATRKAARTLQWNASSDAFIAKTSRPGYDWWSGLGRAADTTRGLVGVPVTVVRQALDVGGSISTSLTPHGGLPRPRSLPQRKGPHKIG